MEPNDLVVLFKTELNGMNREQRNAAITSIREVIDDELMEDAVSTGFPQPFCPRCGSISIVKKGHGRNERQRYLCKDCGRTFQISASGVLGSTKLPRSVWSTYAECFVLRLPLRECARRCHVGLKTAWTMRHRLIACLSVHIPAFSVSAGSGCELDETYFRESFKGNHSKGSFEMPRPARHRGGELSKRGLSKEQICVMSGVNDAGGAFLTMCGRGSLSAARALDALRGKVGEGAVVATDRASAYPAALSALGEVVHRAYDPRDRSRGTINRVNSLHSQLKAFMERFRGVSTKHLQAYLDWFVWSRTFSGAMATIRQIAASTKRTRVCDLFNIQAPYPAYWARAIAS